MSKLKKDSPNKWVATAVMIAATLYQVGSGIANNAKRQKALRRAGDLDRELQGQMDAMRDYDFRVQNPYEDIDVTTKAQEVAANQQTQQAADILANLAPVAGAGATASLATSIAKQGSAAAAKLQGRMAQQEFQLQQKAAGAQLAIDRGVKQQEFSRDAALMNMQMYRAAGEYAQAAQFGQAAQANFASAVETGSAAVQSMPDIKKTTTTNFEEIAPDQKFESGFDPNYMEPAENRFIGSENTGAQGSNTGYQIGDYGIGVPQTPGTGQNFYDMSRFNFDQNFNQ